MVKFRPDLLYLSYRSFCTSRKAPSSPLSSLLLTMPKDPSHIAGAQRQRAKIKEKYQKYVPGHVKLQVLGSGAVGAPTSLYMFTDQARYMFNCGEGTQRLAHEHKMKLSKLEHIFVTSPTWDNLGGLPGIALTIQDVGVSELKLHGPEGTDELFQAARRFVVLKNLSVNMQVCEAGKQFSDNVFSVEYVPIFRSSEGSSDSDGSKDEFSDDDIDYYAYADSARTDQFQQKLSFSKKSQVSMNYVCKLHPKPGSLSLEKCVEAGITPGPLLGMLKNGQDVVLESGKVVKSKDVCEPSDPGPIFLVVDCPSVDYLDSFLTNSVLKSYHGTAESPDLPVLVVHFTRSSVANDAKYLEWMEKFPKSTHHLMLNDENQCRGSIAVHRIQYKLNLLHPDIFPVLQDDGIAIDNDYESSKKLKLDDSVAEMPLKVDDSLTVTSGRIQANTLHSFNLRPQGGFDRSNEIVIVPSAYIEETMVIEDFPDNLKMLKGKLSSEDLPNVRPFPEVLFLGTGSCIPNKTRNTSGILLRASDGVNILMDCGEGTFGQIVRFYGMERSSEILLNLRAVYVSHLHADHHIGLIGLLKGRRDVLKRHNLPVEPLYLLAPKQIMSWLHLFDKRFEKICHEFRLIPIGDIVMGNYQLDTDVQRRLLDELNMLEISTVQVRHCPNAFGVAFTTSDKVKVTYSGDTMPCDRLVALGQDSDLLIHEATMEDDLAKEAIIKMHSTTSQAIEIGQKMKAKYIVLTHFSQRYAKLPILNDNFGANVAIAFDNMKVKLDQLKLLPHFYPALKSMFAEHYEEMEVKAMKRQLKSEREQQPIKVSV